MAYNPLLPAGQATKANSNPVVIASDDDIQAKLGIVTETAPASDTASSGLNGRLQRIAQRLTSLIALLPTSLGQKTMANSLAVTLASDQSAIPVTATPVTDIAPATQNITVIDSGSSSAAGANNQTVIIGTPTAGSAASFTLASIETVRVEVTGIWTGTIAAEQSIDGGTTWVGIGLHQGAYTTGSFTAGFVGGANMAGATNFRMRATAAITGTVVVKIIESVNTQSVYIANAAPSGTVISVLNSSTATLGGNAVYTGTGEDVTNFSEMRISVISNAASATDGLSIQQSPDNTNWDITDTYTIAAATAKTFVVPRQARYFRVVYTNGAGAQGSFRLQSILNRTATAPSSQRATDAYTNETDLVQNQVFPMGYNGTTWDRLRSVLTGSLKTDMSSIAGTATDTNSGNKSAGTQRMVIATDQPNLTTALNVALAANQSVNVAQINGVTPLTGTGNTGTGSQRVTLATDQAALTTAGLFSVKVDQTTPGTTNAVQDIASTVGGESFNYLLSANSNNKTQVKSSAGQVYSISIQNISAAPIYLKMFDNTSAGVTAGTTAASYQYMCPANATAANGAGIVVEFPKGRVHATGITFLLTTGISSTDNTSVAANIGIVNIGYK